MTPPLIAHNHRNLMAPDEMKNLGFQEDSNDATTKPASPPTSEPPSKGSK